MPVARLLKETAARFPHFSDDACRIDALEKGGSDRKYYRVAHHQETAQQSLILVQYGFQREENLHYCEIDAFLAELGVRVPSIYAHDPDERLIWMEDLGETDLWHFRAEPWTRRRALYRDALAQVARLHLREARVAGRLRLQPGFDAALYRWEQAYFFEHCAGRHFRAEAALRAEAERCPRLGEIAEWLAGRERVLVHRDFQSQNIMVREGRAYLIDFQGMRGGLGEYDLASLLYDPYVPLSEAERAVLLEDYAELRAAAGAPLAGDFREIYHCCALQRLLQALGAYGFLGHEKGRVAFLAHIPPALASLREVTARIEGLEPLRRLLETFFE